MRHPVQIAVTAGEPAGIGPELVLKLAQMTLPFEIVAIADNALLKRLANQLNMNVQFNDFDSNPATATHSSGRLNVVDIPVAGPVSPGRPDVKNSGHVIEALNTAIDLVQNNVCQALTTGPVQKSIINEADISFSGHTEFIAEKTGGYPVMLLTDETFRKKSENKLRVALVTTHLAISRVAAQITPQRIERVLRVLHQALIQCFHISSPHICVCGLNPHAGENGYLGTEETELICPLLERLRDDGMNIDGPIPADVAFTPAKLAGKDAVVAMYHDQGLPVIKHLGFGKIVNVTLGLPIIRTSVDHGTALDIAGRGIASADSLHTAAFLAAQLASNARARLTTQETHGRKQGF